MISRDDAAREASRGDLGEAGDWLRTRWLAALAGLLSGLAAFGIGEAAYIRIPARKVVVRVGAGVAPVVTGAAPAAADTRNAAIARGVLGLCLGGGLGIAGGLSRRSRSAALRAGVLGGTLGAGLAGGVSLLSFQIFAGARSATPKYSILISMAMHGLTWGLAGAAGGLAFAVGLGQRRLRLRAPMAGLAGAVLAACALELAGASLFPRAHPSDSVATIWPIRLVARLWVTAATAACVTLVLRGPSRAAVVASRPMKSRRRRS